MTRPPTGGIGGPRQRKGRPIMATVGAIATAIVAVVAAIGVYIGVRSVPDMRRYLRMRRM